MRPTGRHVSGRSPNSSGTATEKPLEAPASRGFSFWPKTDERPSPIALARRATMDAAFSDACVRILNVTGCAGQAEPARRMGARQAAISDSRRRGQTGSEILPALLKRLGLAPQYGRSAHALTSKRPGTPMAPVHIFYLFEILTTSPILCFGHISLGTSRISGNASTAARFCLSMTYW